MRPLPRSDKAGENPTPSAVVCESKHGLGLVTNSCSNTAASNLRAQMKGVEMSVLIPSVATTKAGGGSEISRAMSSPRIVPGGHPSDHHVNWPEGRDFMTSFSHVLKYARSSAR